VADATREYANLTGRPPGALVTALGRVLPGVAGVQRQVGPFAQAWRSANVTALAGSGRRWIVLGDSMSQGIGAETPWGGWVSQVQAEAAARGVELDVVNLSASGARVSDLLRQQLPAWRAIGPRPESDPDVVTVLVGSNDLMSRRHRDDLPDAFASLLDQLPTGAIVATLPQPRRAAAAVNERIAAARVERGIRVVDMRRSGPSSWRGRLAADHFHPNERGYRAIAEAFLPLVLDAASSD
jgi:lysophospholipase L1-like esterase